jgi:hypothetical protein
MTSVYMPAFYLGVCEELEKAARCWTGYEPVPGKKPYSEDSCRPKGSSTKKEKEKKSTKVAFDVASMPVNENILPNIASQAKWKYAKHKGGALKLSDGNLVYSFAMPESYPAEDARVSRLDDDNILNFDKDAISKGTAQIHRSSPDNVYMTLANGAENPTFMLQHEEGKNWRYSPAKKFLEKLKALGSGSSSEANDTLPLDPKALLDGAHDSVKEATYLPFTGQGVFDSPEEAAEWLKDKYHTAEDSISRFSKARAEAPVTSMLGGYAIAHGIGAVRDALDPSRVEARKSDPEERLKRELLPVAAGVLPTLASMAINTK